MSALLDIDQATSGFVLDKFRGVFANCKFVVRECYGDVQAKREQDGKCIYDTHFAFEVDLADGGKFSSHQWLDEDGEPKINEQTGEIGERYDTWKVADANLLIPCNGWTPELEKMSDDDFEGFIDHMIENGLAFDPENPDPDFEGEYVIAYVQHKSIDKRSKFWNRCAYLKEAIESTGKSPADVKWNAGIASSFNGLDVFFDRLPTIKGGTMPETAEEKEKLPLTPTEFFGRVESKTGAKSSKTSAGTSSKSSASASKSKKKSDTTDEPEGRTKAREIIESALALSDEGDGASLTFDELVELAGGSGATYEAVLEIDDSLGYENGKQKVQGLTSVKNFAKTGFLDTISGATWDAKAKTLSTS